MARDVEVLFHETWLGEAQPLQGLTFSVPVLVVTASSVETISLVAVTVPSRMLTPESQSGPPRTRPIR